MVFLVNFMKKLAVLVSLALCLATPRVYSVGMTESAALPLIQELLNEFVGQYRLKVDMEQLHLDFNERFYQKKRIKAAKVFKEQAFKMRIMFKRQEDRLIPLSAEAIATRLDEEVIQRFCRDQNLKSTKVKFIVLDIDDTRAPSEELPTANVSLESTKRGDIGFKITAKCVLRSKMGRR